MITLNSRRRLLLRIAIALLAAAAVGGVGVYLRVGNPLDPFDDRRFDPQRWRQFDVQKRARMARDIVDRRVLPGMSIAQVEQLLGPPDGRLAGMDDGDNALPGISTHAYILGSWSMYGYDSAYVYVHFDAAAVVISAEINGY